MATTDKNGIRYIWNGREFVLEDGQTIWIICSFLNNQEYYFAGIIPDNMIIWKENKDEAIKFGEMQMALTTAKQNKLVFNWSVQKYVV